MWCDVVWCNNLWRYGRYCDSMVHCELRSFHTIKWVCHIIWCDVVLVHHAVQCKREQWSDIASSASILFHSLLFPPPLFLSPLLPTPLFLTSSSSSSACCLVSISHRAALTLPRSVSTARPKGRDGSGGESRMLCGLISLHWVGAWTSYIWCMR